MMRSLPCQRAPARQRVIEVSGQGEGGVGGTAAVIQ